MRGIKENKIISTSETMMCSVNIQTNKLSITSTGDVAAIHFHYSGNCTFKNLTGPGVILRATEDQVVMLALGKTLQGDILALSGDVKITKIIISGSDAKKVQDIKITYEKNTWNQLESKYEESTQFYKKKINTGSRGSINPLDLVSNYRSNTGNANIPYKENLNGKDVELYLEGERYVDLFHVDIDSGIAYTGARHKIGSVPLSYTKPSAKKTVEKLEDIYEMLKPVHKLKGYFKNIKDTKGPKGSKGSGRKKSSYARGSTSSPGGSGGSPVSGGY